MMRIWIWAVALWLMVAGTAWAENTTGKPVVVVELFTSQGCSSCPPADAFLHELAKREDVIALSLHVDYWDYLGWKDAFAQNIFTKRQQTYAKVGHRRSVYTPQMIIQGQEHVVGNHPMDVTDIIAKFQKRSQAVTLKASRNGGKLRIAAQSRRPIKGPLVVHVVDYSPSAKTEIRRGENAGKTISYVNVARVWTVAGQWNGAAPLDMKVRAGKSKHTIVIVQSGTNGPILAATRVE